ncbi:MAG: hypothetical protein FWF41_04995 [Betaproteobacteria bacterium]|nr:hypothetical protein [Betaproteobacteria bacterium]
MSATFHAPAPASPERFPVMGRSGVRTLLRFVGAALMTGLLSSLVLMAAILFLVGSASS